MSDREQRLRNQQQKGREAKEILDTPIVQQAFEDIEKRITEAWKDASAKDEELVKRCKYTMDAYKSVREYFQEYVIKGENAKKELLNLEKESGLKRVFK